MHMLLRKLLVITAALAGAITFMPTAASARGVRGGRGRGWGWGGAASGLRTGPGRRGAALGVARDLGWDRAAAQRLVGVPAPPQSLWVSDRRGVMPAQG